MNNLKRILWGIFPLLLLIAVVNQVMEIPGSLNGETPAHRQSIEELAKSVKAIEQAASGAFIEIDTVFEPVTSTPFGKVTVRRKTYSGPSYQRHSLKLQGIMQGDSPLAVLIDQSGKSHIVKKGETVMDRKVVHITASGVTLRDQLGSETLALE